MERHGARSSLKVRPVAAEAQWEAEAERRSYKQDLNGCAVNFIRIQKRTCRIYRIL